MLAFIPANPEYGSLNLAAAVQVVTYELRMARDTAAPDLLRLPMPAVAATAGAGS